MMGPKSKGSFQPSCDRICVSRLTTGCLKQEQTEERSFSKHSVRGSCSGQLHKQQQVPWYTLDDNYNYPSENKIQGGGGNEYGGHGGRGGGIHLSTQTLLTPTLPPPTDTSTTHQRQCRKPSLLKHTKTTHRHRYRISTPTTLSLGLNPNANHNHIPNTTLRLDANPNPNPNRVHSTFEIRRRRGRGWQPTNPSPNPNPNPFQPTLKKTATTGAGAEGPVEHSPQP